MKKKFFLINLFFILAWAYAKAPKIEYEVIQNCEFTRNPKLHKNVLRILNKGEILSNNEMAEGYYDSNIYFIALFDNNQLEGCVDAENIRLKGYASASKELKNKNWIAKYAVDALFNKDINIVFKNEGDIPGYAAKTFTDFGDIKPWEYYMEVPALKITNVDIHINFSLDRYLGVFTQISNNKYESYSLSIWNYIHGKCIDDLKEKENYTFTFKLDGDYLDLYVNNQYLITYVNVDKNVSEQYLNFVKSKTYATENLIWPHHADGTSEYEDTIRYPDPLVIEEPEQIEIEEYDNSSELAASSAAPAENLDRPPFPDKKDPDYWKILQEYYPDDYPPLRFEYLQKRTKIINTVVIPCAIVLGIILLAVLVLVIRKKRAE